MVCMRIYTIFKDVFGCETRVSVEYVFQKKPPNNKEGETRVKMAGRKSKHRCKPRSSVLLSAKEKYYSYKSFTMDKMGTNILSKEEIDNTTLWFKSSENSADVKKYIGIAVSVRNNKKVDFILKIDIMDNFHFGKTDSIQDIEDFVDKYLLPYVNVVTFSYLLNLNRNKVLVEV